MFFYFFFLKVQLSLTLGVIALFIFIPAVSDFALKNFWYNFVWHICSMFPLCNIYLININVF